MFGSNESTQNSTISAMAKANQNSRLKLQTKHNRNLATQMSGTNLNFAKMKNGNKIYSSNV